jgi:hypothetical protein
LQNKKKDEANIHFIFLDVQFLDFEPRRYQENLAERSILLFAVPPPPPNPPNPPPVEVD